MFVLHVSARFFTSTLTIPDNITMVSEGLYISWIDNYFKVLLQPLHDG